VADSYRIDLERGTGGLVTVLRVAGELDISARDDLSGAIGAALSRGGVVVDLAEVTFLDSEALGALIDGYNAARQRRAEFRAINAGGVVERVLTVSGAMELFGS